MKKWFIGVLIISIVLIIGTCLKTGDIFNSTVWIGIAAMLASNFIIMKIVMELSKNK
jgi:hypothetical protein